MDTYTWALISTVAGSILLLWLSYNDFSKKIIRPINAGRYYLAFSLFSFINIIVYLGFCLFFLDVDLISGIRAVLQSPSVSKETASNGHYSPLQVINPIVIAVMYFATGSATFKLGKHKIDLYQQLLGVFQRLLSLQFAEIEQIRKSIEKANTKLNALKDRIKSLHSTVESQGWDNMEEQWSEVNSDVQLIDEQVHYLADLRNQLSGPINIDKIEKDIDTRIHDMQSNQIAKLKDYIFKFIITNIKNEEDIDNLIQDLGGERLIPEDGEQNLVARCVVVCGLFGLLFGPIFSNFEENMNLIRYSWYGAVTLGMFGLIFSTIRNAKKNVKDFLLRALISGGMAGVVAHTVWMLLRSVDPQNSVAFEPEQLVFGLEFGVALGLIIFFFRTTTLQMSTMIRAGAMAIAGGVTFMLLGYINDMDDAAERMGAEGLHIYVMLTLLGAVVTLGLATGLNIIKKTKGGTT